jgi:L-alanine-DL-glutamate epimerase-like enolase superfamily enzyme
VSLSPVTDLKATAYTIPIDAPEADGTLSWDSTTIVVVQAHCGNVVGTGWTYGSAAGAQVVNSQLAGEVIGRSAFDVAGSSDAMIRALRNVGRQGIGGQALSAVDIALWDLKARLLQIPLHRLIGAVRDAVEVYGSGRIHLLQRTTAA